MLQQWGTMLSPAQPPVQSQPTSTNIVSPSPATHPIPQETPEQREYRLRKLYETALQTHQTSQPTAAKPLFQHLATELTLTHPPSPTTPSPSKKRARPQQPAPLWERNLRYAVQRNLAEVHAHLNEHLAATHMYAHALTTDRSDFLVWLRAARSAARCGHLHVARRAFEAALRMRPAHWLCRDGYRAVLAAIGDADEDCTPTPPSDRAFEAGVARILTDRHRHIVLEREERKAAEPDAPEVLLLEELTWAAVIDALRLCLDRRLSATDAAASPVGRPLRFQLPPAVTPACTTRVAGVSPDGVQIVAETSVDRAAAANARMVEVVVLPDTPERARDKSANHTPDKGVAVGMRTTPVDALQGSEASQLGTRGAEGENRGAISSQTPPKVASTTTPAVAIATTADSAQHSTAKDVLLSTPGDASPEPHNNAPDDQREGPTAVASIDVHDGVLDRSQPIADPDADLVAPMAAQGGSEEGANVEEMRSEEAQPEGVQPHESRCDEAQFNEAQPEEARLEGAQLEGGRVDEMQPGVSSSNPPLTRPTVKQEDMPVKRPEIRRSARQRTQVELQTAEGERRQTRNAAGMVDSTQEDASLIQALLDMCQDKQDGYRGNGRSPSHASDDAEDESPSNATDKTNVKLEVERKCSWIKVVGEREEAIEVKKCVESFHGANSGPTDLLLRVLSILSSMNVTQYSSELAMLWATLRAKVQLHMPGPLSTTSLIIEAMLASGKKAGKAKARRFQEASRLLSHVRFSAIDVGEDMFLRMRLSWLWGLLHECRGQMQLSFRYAEHTLALLQRIGEGTSTNSPIPDIAGPALSGFTIEGLEDFIQNRILSLKRARDLEKAIEELSKAGKGDKEAANRTVSILASSIHSSVKSLGLTRWHSNDLKVEFSNMMELEAWERRLDSEIELEPRLKVFGEACAKSSDSIGELVCFSLRLRMAVHYYIAKVRSEMEKDKGQGKDDDSSSSRLADLLVQVRKYVALIKKLSSQASSGLWNCKVGVSGWSMRDAVAIASITLVSLTELIITKIPLLRFSGAITEMGASQKNRRLAFTRCMLAFARCVMLKHKCEEVGAGDRETDLALPTERRSEVTKKMLHVISFCLHALVARGCCREEGTSGALIKLYVRYLLTRLEEISSSSEKAKREAAKSKGNVLSVKALMNPVSSDDESGRENSPPTKDFERSTEDRSDDSSKHGDAMETASPNYKWCDVHVIRFELGQCYQCLYQIQDLQTISGDANVLKDVRWLEEGCRVSKHIGLSFTTGDPVASVPTIDTDVCKDVYFFYRKRIFEAVCLRRRDGRKAKRLREVLSRLAEALPEDPPPGVQMLPFHALDTIVSEVVDSRVDISREAAGNVSKLQEEWVRSDTTESGDEENTSVRVRNIQLSVLYFEVFALHAMSILAAHESEYKKHKTAERRKRPKEVAERLLTASSECLVALRSRPWSVGTWILLGRIFVEIADLALDEREINLSTFGLYRSDDMATLGDGDTVQTIFGRAEACFGFADSLLRHSWAQNACNVTIDLDVALVLGHAYDGNDREPWSGFGDDGDLFGSFGLTNKTTSRPRLRYESHPSYESTEEDVRRLAAIRFGSAALSVLRLREMRYYHLHWSQSALDFRLLTHPVNRFPESFIQFASDALSQLREGRELFFSQSLESFGGVPEKKTVDNADFSLGTAPNVQREGDVLSWRSGYVGVEKLQWYYTFLEAKLMRKVGRPAEEYLAFFHKAIQENRSVRQSLKLPPDTEPVYKLHASRLKILRTAEDNGSATGVLTLLEKYSFKEQGPIVVDDANDKNKDVEEWIMERKIAIAEDILSAMQLCRDSKSEVAYSEFHFKSTFCIALLLADVLKDVKGALAELGKLFRIDAAVKALDQGPDASHRGYFYLIWNYRITDTGIEPALETERKLFRWRTKLLGLYGQLLSQTGEWRGLAAIISRLKKRSPEDLPVDGAVLDDLITAYAITRRTAILNSMEKAIVTDVSAFQSSYRRTWDVYIESLRLAQGIRRVRVSLSRGETFETGSERLLGCSRPRCLMAIHTALRLEYLRWRSAGGAITLDVRALRDLPVEGSIRSLPLSIRADFVETLQSSVDKWALDEKMTKLLLRRVSEYSAP